MNHQLLVTQDGSHTVRLEQEQVTFHSIYGAINESRHVFIQAGLEPMLEEFESLRIFEMGFGTGLNAWLTLLEAQKRKTNIEYCAIEAYPLDAALVASLNYPELLKEDNLQPIFVEMHAAPWNQQFALTGYFSVKKIKSGLEDYHTEEKFHLIYFDAFAPDVQPELWTKEIFEKIFQWLLPGGCLVTYSAKGKVRRNLQTVGFVIEKLPGPHPKREMTRARRPA
jgi:tRNA U34 5-methylaminomethyl-2-thiouridine-forming methyltransferase MnmC